MENVIQVRVHPTTDLTGVRLIRDGEVIATAQPTAGEAPYVTFTDRAAGDAEHYYYAEIVQTPEPGLDYPGIAWTSPVWVVPEHGSDHHVKHR